MFTTIIHPVTGEERQIKTGRDQCKTYRLGDLVDWSIDPDRPGEGTLLDGAYYDHDCTHYVVIAGHRVKAVEPVPPYQPGRTQLSLDALFAAHGGKPTPDEFWSDRAWARAARREAVQHWRDACEEAELAKLPPGERAAAALDRFTREKMQVPSFVSQLFAPREPLSQSRWLTILDSGDCERIANGLFRPISFRGYRRVWNSVELLFEIGSTEVVVLGDRLPGALVERPWQLETKPINNWPAVLRNAFWPVLRRLFQEQQPDLVQLFPARPDEMARIREPGDSEDPEA